MTLLDKITEKVLTKRGVTLTMSNKGKSVLECGCARGERLPRQARLWVQTPSPAPILYLKLKGEQQSRFTTERSRMLTSEQSAMLTTVRQRSQQQSQQYFPRAERQKLQSMTRSIRLPKRGREE